MVAGYIVSVGDGQGGEDRASFSVYAQLTVLFYQRQHRDQSQMVRTDVPLLAWWSFVKTGASSGQPH